MAKSLDAFHPDVAAHLAGCPDPVMDRAILNAAIEFCQRSLAWNETQDAETITLADLPYQVGGAPAGGVVCEVVSVSVDGNAVDQKNARTLDARGDWRSETGVSEGYVMVAADTIDLWRRPAAADTVSMIVTAAYMPTRSASSLPDFLYTQHAESIAAGALARLFILPGQPWTDAGLATGWRGMFNAAADELRAKVMRSFGGPVRVTYRSC
jgi:hypothetical protein